MPETLEPLNDSPYCGVITKAGHPCMAFKAASRDTCASHDPETIRHRRPNISTYTIQRVENERDAIIKRIARLRERLAATESRLARYRGG